MNVFQEMSKGCERKDCRFYSRGAMSTCMGYTPYFDKDGNPSVLGDPNITTEKMGCSVCGKEWVIITQQSKTTVLNSPSATRA